MVVLEALELVLAPRIQGVSTSPWCFHCYSRDSEGWEVVASMAAEYSEEPRVNPKGVEEGAEDLDHQLSPSSLLLVLVLMLMSSPILTTLLMPMLSPTSQHSSASTKH